MLIPKTMKEVCARAADVACQAANRSPLLRGLTYTVGSLLSFGATYQKTWPCREPRRLLGRPLRAQFPLPLGPRRVVRLLRPDHHPLSSPEKCIGSKSVGDRLVPRELISLGRCVENWRDNRLFKQLPAV